MKELKPIETKNNIFDDRYYSFHNEFGHLCLYDHFLEPNLLRVFEEIDANCLSGELNFLRLRNVFLNEPINVRTKWQAIAEKNSGGDEKPQIEDREYLKKLILQGTNFWLTDGYTYEVVARNNDYYSLYYFAFYYFLSVALPVGTGIYSAASLATEKKVDDVKKISRRDFLKGVLFASGSIVATQISRYIHNPENHEEDIEKIREFWNNPEFITNTLARVDFRDHIMVQNHRHMKFLYELEVEKILCFAGGRHSKMKELIQEENEELIENRVKEFADILITKTVDLLISQHSLSDEKVVEILVNYISLFPQPLQVGINEKDFIIEDIYKKVPKNTCAILVERIIFFLKNTTELDNRKRKILNEFLLGIIEKNIFWQNDMRNSLKHFLNDRDRSNNYVEKRKITVYPSSLKIIDLSAFYYFENPDDEILGVATFLGRVVPIIANTTIYGREQALLVDDYRILELDHKS